MASSSESGPILAAAVLLEDEKKPRLGGAVSVQKNRAVTARFRFPPVPIN
jgi:hypothetical protein